MRVHSKPSSFFPDHPVDHSLGSTGRSSRSRAFGGQPLERVRANVFGAPPKQQQNALVWPPNAVEEILAREALVQSARDLRVMRLHSEQNSYTTDSYSLPTPPL